MPAGRRRSTEAIGGLVLDVTPRGSISVPVLHSLFLFLFCFWVAHVVGELSAVCLRKRTFSYARTPCVWMVLI